MSNKQILALTIPTLGEILSAPMPDPCYGPMAHQKPPTWVTVSEMTEDEKKVCHWLVIATHKENLFNVEISHRRITSANEDSCSPFDLTKFKKELEKQDQENVILATLAAKEKALEQILFGMIRIRLADQLPPEGITICIYENFEIGYSFINEED